MVLLPDCSLSNAEDVAERVRTAVNGLQMETETSQIKPSVSVGVGQVPANAETVTEALAVLGPALQRGKRSGKNAV